VQNFRTPIHPPPLGDIQRSFQGGGTQPECPRCAGRGAGEEESGGAAAHPSGARGEVEKKIRK